MSKGQCLGKHDLERFRFQRTFDLHYPKDRMPNGRHPCRWCGGEIPEGRVWWCGDDCVKDFYIKSGSSGYITAYVQQRDQGVCAICGVDTQQLDRIIRKLYNQRSQEHAMARLGHLYQKYPWAFYRYGAPALLQPQPRCLWEADHIVPVSEGGGACGLENFRTLCLPCHKAETKKLHSRLAKARKKS